MDLKEFWQGNCFDAYEYFGAHIQDEGVCFRIYAPNAKKVSLIGDFNGWQNETVMNYNFNGVYEIKIPSAKKGQMYKYKVYSDEYNYVEHTDPYAFYMELRPDFASIITDLNSYKFTDEKYLEKRTKSFDEPLNIYEMHLGSWKEPKDRDKQEFLSYVQIAELLVPYLKEHGYNAVEFMPLTEHPMDISWGYQSTGYFSPTSRYGTPDELKALINTLHLNDIKVIMDFVPVHFATDYYALAKMGGRAFYEYPDDEMELSEWGSYNFIHAKGEVASFLCSSANYWLKEFHFDGLRMDAISRIIYYHGDSNRGVNLNGVEFLKKLNIGLNRINKNIIMIAEDSSDYKKVTFPVYDGGLGFDYKWDMGWMNDTLDFFKKTPSQRAKVYNQISFSMMYFYSEKFLLPFSHDENVHGKATIMQKMYGMDKFAQARALYMYMYTHPGKKLNFMGNELGQLREWDETRQQDYDILRFPIHDSFNRYIKDLNALYLNNTALYQQDYRVGAFKWIAVNDDIGVTYAYVRKSDDQKIFCVFNFSDKIHKDYGFEFDNKLRIKELLNSDWDIYSGSTKYEKDNILSTICIKKEEIVTSYKDIFTTTKDVINSETDIIGCEKKVYCKHYLKMDLQPFSARMFLELPIEREVKFE